MSAILEDKDRQVVPRWRKYHLTAELGELDSTSDVARKQWGEDLFLKEKIRDWKAFRTASFAADLVGAAVVFGNHDVGLEAAKFLLDANTNASNPAKKLASSLVSSVQVEQSSFLSDLTSSSNKSELRTGIRNHRNRLRQEPRNALLWADMARIYTVLGSPQSALRAMRIARILAPSSRFVLRANARLKLHLGESDEAHELLRRADSTSKDPWLVASEIAIAAIIQRTSRLVKTGREMLYSRNFDPLHLAELASVLGTLELAAGKERAARKLFQLALRKPTENSLAQIEWASKHNQQLKLAPKDFNVPLSFEARAYHAAQSLNWSEALQQSWNWLNDQPFSSRPASLGSYIAGVFMEDYKEAERIARQGLVASPKDGALLNNIAFAMINEGRLEEGEKILNQIEANNLDDWEKIAPVATRGFLFYRQGRLAEGRKLYLEALDLAAGPGGIRHRFLAAYFLVREELIAGTRESDELKRWFISQTKEIRIPELALLGERLATTKPEEGEAKVPKLFDVFQPLIHRNLIEQ